MAAVIGIALLQPTLGAESVAEALLAADHAYLSSLKEGWEIRIQFFSTLLGPTPMTPASG